MEEERRKYGKELIRTERLTHSIMLDAIGTFSIPQSIISEMEAVQWKELETMRSIAKIHGTYKSVVNSLSYGNSEER